MKRWYGEGRKFQVEVTGFLRGDYTERHCRDGEKVGDRYTCTYGCPVNQDGQGTYFKAMLLFFPLTKTIRSDDDLENVGGSGPYCRGTVCPDGCVLFRLTTKKLGNENLFKGNPLD